MLDFVRTLRLNHGELLLKSDVQAVHAPTVYRVGEPTSAAACPHLTWYLTWCGCTTGSSLDFRTCSNVVNLAASGIRGLNVHEELHLVSSDLVQMCLKRVDCSDLYCFLG